MAKNKKNQKNREKNKNRLIRDDGEEMKEFAIEDYDTGWMIWDDSGAYCKEAVIRAADTLLGITALHNGQKLVEMVKNDYDSYAPFFNDPKNVLKMSCGEDSVVWNCLAAVMDRIRKTLDKKTIFEASRLYNADSPDDPKSQEAKNYCRGRIRKILMSCAKGNFSTAYCEADHCILYAYGTGVPIPAALAAECSSPLYSAEGRRRTMYSLYKLGFPDGRRILETNRNRLLKKIWEYLRTVWDRDLECSWTDVAACIFCIATRPVTYDFTDDPDRPCDGIFSAPSNFMQQVGFTQPYVEDYEDWAEPAINTVNAYIDSYITSLYLSHFYKTRWQLSAPAIRQMNIDGKLSRPTAQEEIAKSKNAYRANAVNRALREQGAESIVVSLVWAMKLAIVKTDLAESARIYTAAAFEKGGEEYESRIEIENKMLKQKLTEANENLWKTENVKNTLKAELEISRKKAIRGNAEKIENAQAPEAVRSDVESERNMRRMVKKEMEQEERIAELTEQNYALQEALSAYRQAKPDADIGKIDTMGKYVFLVDNEALQTKLLTWFPNSSVSRDFFITPDNYKKIDAVICMTKHVSHKECIRLHAPCETYGIPYVFCNRTNFDAICHELSKVF